MENFMKILGVVSILTLAACIVFQLWLSFHLMSQRGGRNYSEAFTKLAIAIIGLWAFGSAAPQFTWLLN